MSTLLSVENLSKQFSEIKAVDALSFSVEKGTVCGFLGQNGAGKSTTIRMILTLIQPSSGAVYFQRKEIRRYRKEALSQIGAIIEKPDLYKYLTALQNLKIMARLSGVKRTEAQYRQQLERVGLADRADSKVKTFSQGMKQRLGIACALVHDPAFIVLDEPTNGLDPQGIADVRNLILRLSREEGKTILISSHLLSEVEQIADHMVIIDKGKKLAAGKVSELLHPSETVVHLNAVNLQQAAEVLGQSAWKDQLQVQHDHIAIRLHQEEIPVLAAYLVQHQVGITSLQSRNSLEDLFLSLTTGNQHVAAYAH
ncbi:MAG TPA: ABC transporter ATP-binding protein [Flavisolibacter sp.]|jgi:ABC-type multidrug transport system ATPase subunit|nr:ABC transporter ATP-binding protein [Flavisolibacter sp.]